MKPQIHQLLIANANIHQGLNSCGASGYILKDHKHAHDAQEDGEPKMQLHTTWTPKFPSLQLVKKDNIQRKYFKIVCMIHWQMTFLLK